MERSYNSDLLKKSTGTKITASASDERFQESLTQAADRTNHTRKFFHKLITAFNQVNPQESKDALAVYGCYLYKADLTKLAKDFLVSVDTIEPYYAAAISQGTRFNLFVQSLLVDGSKNQNEKFKTAEFDAAVLRLLNLGITNSQIIAAILECSKVRQVTKSLNRLCAAGLIEGVEDCLNELVQSLQNQGLGKAEIILEIAKAHNRQNLDPSKSINFMALSKAFKLSKDRVSQIYKELLRKGLLPSNLKHESLPYQNQTIKLRALGLTYEQIAARLGQPSWRVKSTTKALLDLGLIEPKKRRAKTCGLTSNVH